MDDVTKDMIIAQLKHASTVKQTMDALVAAMIAIVQCQASTGGKVRVLWTDRDRRRWIGGIGVALVQSGVLVLVLKILKSQNIF